MNVLLLEDDALVANGLLRILRHLGHRGLHVKTVVDGQALFASQATVDVALVDVGLRNGECGLDFVAWLRREHGGVRRIVISGLELPTGFGHQPPDELFVKKPFGERELAAALAKETRS
jgi:DNA-binding response OmpR family regulator